jgi:hypothetical protein
MWKEVVTLLGLIHVGIDTESHKSTMFKGLRTPKIVRGASLGVHNLLWI